MWGRIESGELAPYDRVPTEKDLYGLRSDDGATRHCELREEGWVFTLPARGTFVSPKE